MGETEPVFEKISVTRWLCHDLAGEPTICQYLLDISLHLQRTQCGYCLQTKSTKPKKHRENTISVAKEHDFVDMYLAAVDNLKLSSRMILP